MIVTTFSMPSDGSAPTCAGAVLLPHRGRLQMQWQDDPGGVTRLHITHPADERDAIVANVTSSHPKVRLEGHRPADA